VYFGDIDKISWVIGYLLIGLLPLIFFLWVLFYFKGSKELKYLGFLFSFICFLAIFILKSYMAFAYLDVIVNGEKKITYTGIVKNLTSGHVYKKFELEGERLFFIHYYHEFCYKKEWSDLLIEGAIVEVHLVKLFFGKDCIVDVKLRKIEESKP